MINRPQGCFRADAQPDQILCCLQNKGYEIKVLQVFARTSSSVKDSSPSISPLVGQPFTEMKLVGLSAAPQPSIVTRLSPRIRDIAY
jgi:hypothetical protein